MKRKSFRKFYYILVFCFIYTNCNLEPSKIQLNNIEKILPSQIEQEDNIVLKGKNYPSNQFDINCDFTLFQPLKESIKKKITLKGRLFSSTEIHTNLPDYFWKSLISNHGTLCGKINIDFFSNNKNKHPIILTAQSESFCIDLFKNKTNNETIISKNNNKLLNILGIAVESSSNGLIVKQVNSNSIASNYGINKNTILLNINGVNLYNTTDISENFEDQISIVAMTNNEIASFDINLNKSDTFIPKNIIIFAIVISLSLLIWSGYLDKFGLWMNKNIFDSIYSFNFKKLIQLIITFTILIIIFYYFYKHITLFNLFIIIQLVSLIEIILQHKYKLIKCLLFSFFRLFPMILIFFFIFWRYSEINISYFVDFKGNWTGSWLVLMNPFVTFLIIIAFFTHRNLVGDNFFSYLYLSFLVLMESTLFLGKLPFGFSSFLIIAIKGIIIISFMPVASMANLKITFSISSIIAFLSILTFFIFEKLSYISYLPFISISLLLITLLYLYIKYLSIKSNILKINYEKNINH